MWENIETLNLQQQKGEEILVSEPNYHTTKILTENLLAIEMKKNRDTFEQTGLFRTFNTRIK